jgi:shikimate kinase
MDDRPLFRDETSFRKLYDERLPFYRQADLRVDGGDAPRQVVERILTSELFGTLRVDA